MLLITWCLWFFSFYIQELEKSKPVILTGDLNCAHQEIDIYNPAVSYPDFVVNKPFWLPNWSLNIRKSVPVILIGPRLRTLRILISQAFPAHCVNPWTSSHTYSLSQMLRTLLCNLIHFLYAMCHLYLVEATNIFRVRVIL